MDTVSQKSLYYTLDKNLNGESILQDIQRLIQKNNNGSQAYVLTISLNHHSSNQRINSSSGV